MIYFCFSESLATLEEFSIDHLRFTADEFSLFQLFLIADHLNSFLTLVTLTYYHWFRFFLGCTLALCSVNRLITCDFFVHFRWQLKYWLCEQGEMSRTKDGDWLTGEHDEQFYLKQKFLIEPERVSEQEAGTLFPAVVELLSMFSSRESAVLRFVWGEQESEHIPRYFGMVCKDACAVISSPRSSSAICIYLWVEDTESSE